LFCILSKYSAVPVIDYKLLIVYKHDVDSLYIISIQYVIIICNDVTRTCSDEIGQNLLSRHFLASFHVCDTIEGFRLVRVRHMVKLLSNLIYCRVIAVSLLVRDKFPQVY
jgi:hypothetical protein